MRSRHVRQPPSRVCLWARRLAAVGDWMVDAGGRLRGDWRL